MLVVMHRRRLYENVDSAKIKVPFYTTDIYILRVASMHRIDIWMNRYTSTRGGVLKRCKHPVVCRGSLPAAGG